MKEFLIGDEQIKLELVSKLIEATGEVTSSDNIIKLARELFSFIKEDSNKEVISGEVTNPENK